MKVEDILLRLDDKVDRVLERQDEMNVVLTKQHASLEEHMRRTAANEQALVLLRDDLATHRANSVTWSFLGKVGGTIISLTGTVLGLLKAAGKI